MIAKGELLPDGAGFRCKVCGITVWADPDRKDLAQIPKRLCAACYQFELTRSYRKDEYME